MPLSSRNPETERSGHLSHLKIGDCVSVLGDPRPPSSSSHSHMFQREIRGRAVPTIQRVKEQKKKKETPSEELSTITEERRKKSTSFFRAAARQVCPSLLKSSRGGYRVFKHAGPEEMKRKMTFDKPAMFAGLEERVTCPDCASRTHTQRHLLRSSSPPELCRLQNFALMVEQEKKKKQNQISVVKITMAFL